MGNKKMKIKDCKYILSKDNKNIRAILFIMLIILMIIFIFNLIKNDYKKTNIGNNINNKTLDEIERYIEGINSYETEAEIIINSNKNTNKYLIKETYNKEESKIEILEPSNIKGVIISYKNGNLEVINSSLELTKRYDNYKDVLENNLCLNTFINKIKNENSNNNVVIKGEENEAILIINNNENNKTNNNYKIEEMYINKTESKIEKIVIKNNNNEEKIVILYNKITIN